MKGYLSAAAGHPPASGGEGRLLPWEALATDAVGSVIEFWGFKRNQGRVWALLYLRGVSYTAAELERELSLSKGGVSMLLRDLEHWGVVTRARSATETAYRFTASTDFVRMVARVIAGREADFVARVHAQLEEALRLARESGGVSPMVLGRLERMSALAEQVDRAVRLFLKTARLVIGALIGILREGRPRGGPKSPR